MQRVSTLVVTFSALALSSAAAHAQHQQAVVTCGTPLNALATGSGAWSIAKVGPQPDRTTPPMTTPPATGYVQAVSAGPLDDPPAPPTDPEGYRWDGNMSWISMTPSGASSTNPHHYYVRQQITLDATVDLARFALKYEVAADDQLWAIYINGTRVQAGSPLLVGFGPADPATNYRTTQRLPVTLNSDWRPGLNEIVFAVYDFGGSTGFASQATGMTCQPVTPATVRAVPANDWYGLTLMGLLMAGLGAWRMRRRG